MGAIAAAVIAARRVAKVIAAGVIAARHRVRAITGVVIAVVQCDEAIPAAGIASLHGTEAIAGAVIASVRAMLADFGGGLGGFARRRVEDTFTDRREEVVKESVGIGHAELIEDVVDEGLGEEGGYRLFALRAFVHCVDDIDF